MRMVLADRDREGVAGESIQEGEHVWIVRARAGHYRWRSVHFDAQAGNAEVYWPDEDEFRFEVVAGNFNYAGALIIRAPTRADRFRATSAFVTATVPPWRFSSSAIGTNPC